jgi:hypothetical protein
MYAWRIFALCLSYLQKKKKLKILCKTKPCWKKILNTWLFDFMVLVLQKWRTKVARPKHLTDSEHLFQRAEERDVGERGSSESPRRARWLLSNHRAKTRTVLFLSLYFIYMKCRFKTLSLCRCSGHNKLLINPQWGLIEGLGQLLFCECECFSCSLLWWCATLAPRGWDLFRQSDDDAADGAGRRDHHYAPSARKNTLKTQNARWWCTF